MNQLFLSNGVVKTSGGILSVVSLVPLPPNPHSSEKASAISMATYDRGNKIPSMWKFCLFNAKLIVSL